MKTLITKTIFTVAITSTSFAIAAEKIDPVSGVCNPPKSRLYKKETANDSVHLEIIANFSKIEKQNGAAPSEIKGVLKYYDIEDGALFMPVLLSGRGNSRGSFCTFKPFRMAFVPSEVAGKIQRTLADKNILPDSDDYLKAYYDAFSAIPVEAKTSAKPDKNTLFDHLGDDVKVVTHCGVGTFGGNWPGAKTEEEQNQRLLAEYYIYEILGTLKTTVESARLANIKYFNPNGTPVFVQNVDGKAVVLPKVAFFREPPTSIAKRCNLLSKPPLAANVVALKGISDGRSLFTHKVINNFVINSDFRIDGFEGKQGHNTNYFFDKNGNKYFGAYDFDLAGTIGNVGDEKDDKHSFEYGASTLRMSLNASDTNPYSTPLIKRFLEAENQMRSIIENSFLTDKYRRKGLSLLEFQFKVLHEVALQRSENDEKTTTKWDDR